MMNDITDLNEYLKYRIIDYDGDLINHIVFYAHDLYDRIDLTEYSGYSIFVACFVISLKYNVAIDRDFYCFDESYCISLNKISDIFNVENNELKELEVVILKETEWKPFECKCMY